MIRELSVIIWDEFIEGKLGVMMNILPFRKSSGLPSQFSWFLGLSSKSSISNNLTGMVAQSH